MKIRRQSKILELIKENEVETQEMLAELLVKEGFNVTQATVSRDIRELKLSKVSTGSGRQKYIAVAGSQSGVAEKFERIFREGVVTLDYAGNIIVIKTLTGMAMAVAAALDSMDRSEIMGCIAGDDTIFCAVRSEQKAIELIEDLRNYSRGSRV